MSGLSIDKRQLDGDIVLIKASGFLDAHTFEEMENVIEDLFRNRVFKIIVRLDRLDYISSAGAGVFIWAHSESQEYGGDVIVLNPTKTVTQVFELLGLTQVFRIARTKEEALAAF